MNNYEIIVYRYQYIRSRLRKMKCELDSPPEAEHEKN